jgi:hypothetical protein
MSKPLVTTALEHLQQTTLYPPKAEIKRYCTCLSPTETVKYCSVGEKTRKRKAGHTVPIMSSVYAVSSKAHVLVETDN